MALAAPESVTSYAFPLQQGLRLNSLINYYNTIVRDHLPLQQGLRQQSILSRIVRNCQRPFSPRISYAMTKLERVPLCSFGLNGDFHYNKD